MYIICIYLFIGMSHRKDSLYKDIPLFNRVEKTSLKKRKIPKRFEDRLLLWPPLTTSAEKSWGSWKSWVECLKSSPSWGPILPIDHHQRWLRRKHAEKWCHMKGKKRNNNKATFKIPMEKYEVKQENNGIFEGVSISKNLRYPKSSIRRNFISKVWGAISEGCPFVSTGVQG